MTRIKYTAKFEDGTVLNRSSERAYAAAYLVRFEGVYSANFGSLAGQPLKSDVSGFSRTHDLAVRAAASEKKRLAKNGWNVTFAQVADAAAF